MTGLSLTDMVVVVLLLREVRGLCALILKARRVERAPRLPSRRQHEGAPPRELDEPRK